VDFHYDGSRAVSFSQEKIMPQTLIVLKIALMGQKSIWRKIAMKESHTLDDLHEVIFGAFDRDDEHLYSFYFPPPNLKFSLRNLRKCREFTHPYAVVDSPFGSDAGNAATAKIGSLQLKAKQKFYYLFDFGDEWWHEITVEETESQPAKGKKYPCVVDQKGKSPPQYPDYDDEDDYDEDNEEA
jgi:hypothetical protein